MSGDKIRAGQDTTNKQLYFGGGGRMANVTIHTPPKKNNKKISPPNKIEKINLLVQNEEPLQHNSDSAKVLLRHSLTIPSEEGKALKTQNYLKSH